MNQDSFTHVHVQENPANSLLWQFSELQLPGLEDLESNHTPTEAAYPWHDTQYYSCHWGGVRCKSQKLRSNSEHLTEAFAVVSVSGECGHEHSRSEWEPFLQDGKWVYPTRFEIESILHAWCGRRQWLCHGTQFCTWAIG